MEKKLKMKRIPTQQKLVLTLLKIVASMLHFTKCFILFMLNGVRGDKKNDEKNTLLFLFF
jgi:hypothetical protein